MHLIIGMGEIGQALFEVLNGERIGYDTKSGKDFEAPIDVVEYLHICFPASKTFFKDVREYIEIIKPKMVIIHSTVEIGWTRELCSKNSRYKDYQIVHSPVRGSHPYLRDSLIKYIKYIGADTEEDYEYARKGMKGIHTAWMKPIEATEIAKLLSLARYGLSISFAKEQDRMCKEHGVMYEEVVQGWEITYNEGLMLEGRTQYTRPLIMPPKGEIGGHCVVPAMEKVSKESELISNALKVVGRDTKVWHYSNIMKDAEIGEGCTIGSYVEIGEGVKIGDRCKIEAGAFIPKGVKIGDNVFVGPNVVFTNDKYPRAIGEWENILTVVDNGVSIGANSTILPGVMLGKCCMIGAGSVVVESTKEYGLYYGNPARFNGWVCECGNSMAKIAGVYDNIKCETCLKEYTVRIDGYTESGLYIEPVEAEGERTG